MHLRTDHHSQITSSTSIRLQAACALAGILLLAGCSTLPSAGPRAGSFDNAKWNYGTEEAAAAPDTEEGVPFVMVNVDRKIVKSLAAAEDKTYFKGAFNDRAGPTGMLLGVGDTVRITIFEAGAGGLFVPANGNNTGGNYVTLPDQEVDSSGRISVPYAGKDNNSGFVKAAGRRLVDVQNEIQEKLMNKAIEPQVIVSIVKRTSNLFSVMGDVNAPGRFNLEQGGVRVLDAVSLAGGPKSNDYNTLITIQRGTTSATARLSTVLTESANNIFIQPNDLIAVKKDERYYNVLGATRTNNRIPFEAENVTVADAISKAGGLNGDVASPATVVVFRREDPAALTNMGVSLDGIKDDEPVPTVYRFNLNEPSGMFLAQRMQLRDNDAVYVSTTTFSDVTKLLGALRDVLLIKLIQD